MKLRVVGVLAPAGTPDDRAVFVDVKTGSPRAVPEEVVKVFQNP